MTQLAAVGPQAIRELEFPHLVGCTFLNAGSFGPLPRRTRVAVDALLRMREAAPDEYARLDFAEPLDRCRRAAAALVGARPEEIALGPNTSFGLFLAATLLPQVCRRDGRPLEDATLLVSDREFPANVLPWLGLRRRGARVEIVPTDAHGFPREDAIVERLGRGDVALLAVSAVQFASGHRADLERLGAACRRMGTLFVVDAIQAAGAAPIDVRAAHVDVLACGGQKWLCAPHGSGFAYVRDELCDRFEPPLRGWLSTTAALDFASLLDYGAPLVDDARRFEQGSHAIQDHAGLACSIELLLELGVGRIAAHLAELRAPLQDWAMRHPRARLASPPPGTADSAIVCIALGDTARAFERLTEAGIVCALREGVLRFSPHVYNTSDEIGGVVALLDEVA